MFESLFWYKVLTKEDSARIIKEFNTKMSDKSKLASCGSCGERKYDAIFKEINVKIELDILKLNENQMQDWNNLDVYKDIASVSKIDDILYHIHPECITERDGIYLTSFCSGCNYDIKRN